MEQIKKISMIKPEEGADTHLEAHEKINSAITQFYGLFTDIISQFKSLSNKQEDAEEKNSTSFSKLKEDVDGLKKDIQGLSRQIEEITIKLNKRKEFHTKNYEGIVDTDKETTVELEPITDIKGGHYLVNIVVNEAIPNQGTVTYAFPKTSIVEGEYTPRVYLMAKDGEHAVLEYDFTVILTEI